MKYLFTFLMLALSATSYAADCNPGTTACLGKDSISVWVRINAASLSGGADTQTSGDFCWQIQYRPPGYTVPVYANLYDLPSANPYPGNNLLYRTGTSSAGVWIFEVHGARSTEPQRCPATLPLLWQDAISFP